MAIASMYAEVSGKSLEDLVIPTTNFIRYNCQLGLAIDSRLSLLMNGPAACGKSLYVRIFPPVFLSIPSQYFVAREWPGKDGVVMA